MTSKASHWAERTHSTKQKKTGAEKAHSRSPGASHHNFAAISGEKCCFCSRKLPVSKGPLVAYDRRLILSAKISKRTSISRQHWQLQYNKVNRRPAQLTFLMIWTIKLANSGLPPWFEGKPEKGFFLQSREAGIGTSEVLVGFKRGEKCRSRSSIFPRKEGGAKKIEPKVVRLLSFSRES